MKQTYLLYVDLYIDEFYLKNNFFLINTFYGIAISQLLPILASTDFATKPQWWLLGECSVGVEQLILTGTITCHCCWCRFVSPHCSEPF